MLQARGLRKRYGSVEALKGLDLDVESGDIYCLLGANGAGKTTTISLFLNFIQPDGGDAAVGGLNVAEHPLEARRMLAYIPEQVTLYGNLTAVENLRYFTRLGGRDYSPKEYRNFLGRADLQPEAMDRRMKTCSKGMRQKTGIAIALARKAGALLLDEPTAGLDPKASNEFSELLLKLKADGAAILMATHDLFRARETGTRIGIMKEGRLVEEMSADEVSHVDVEQIYLRHMRAGGHGAPADAGTDGH